MPITLHTEVEELPIQTDLVVGRYRDPFQLQIDADVESLKTSTAKAGWPDPDPGKLFQRYVVDKNDASPLKEVIRRACTLHKVTMEAYKDAKTEAGLIVIKFHVTRKTDKDGKPVSDDTLDKDGKPVKKAPAAAPAAA
jgi:hypothetical protein